MQFLHPGGEHRPDFPGGKDWTRAADGHARKFLRLPGLYLECPDGEAVAAAIEFWGEWEAPSEMTPVTNPILDGPRWVHRPFWRRPPAYQGLQNTDPFVFGDRFLYTGCLQHTKHGPTQLRNLARGSVILFGSKRPGRAEFTLDTVFVVADFVDHARRSYKRKLADKVAEPYKAVTLCPWYQDDESCASPDMSRSYRLYRGATRDDPVDGMFSFFPCRLTADGSPGFARPSIAIPDVITPTQRQGKKLNPRGSLSEIRPLWELVVRQVMEQNLSLGIHAELPEFRSPDAA